MHSQLLQLSLPLCDPMDYSPRGSSVCGILQARILGWVTCPPLGNHPNPVIKSASPALQADFSPIEPPGKPIYIYGVYPIGSVSLENPKRVCILSLTMQQEDTYNENRRLPFSWSQPFSNSLLSFLGCPLFALLLWASIFCIQYSIWWYHISLTRQLWMSIYVKVIFQLQSIIFIIQLFLPC